LFVFCVFSYVVVIQSTGVVFTVEKEQEASQMTLDILVNNNIIYRYVCNHLNFRMFRSERSSVISNLVKSVNLH